MRISQKTFDGRIASVRRRMARVPVDLVVLGPGAHLQWLQGLHPHADERPFLFCLTQDDIAVLVPALEKDSLATQTDLPFFAWKDADGPQGSFAGLITHLKAAAVRHVALDETMRADFAGLVHDHLPHAAFQFTASTVGAERMRKDPEEYQCLKRSALIADCAMQETWSAMRPGLSEQEVAERVRSSFAQHGAQPLFHIIGTGPNGAFPHHQTGGDLLKEGDAIVMDIGGTIDGYPSDITRMAVIGEAPDEYHEIHSIVEAAVEAALGVARPGIPARQIDRAARQVIVDAGYGDFFLHRTGHGLGIEIHEPPDISGGSETILDEGMVFSIEPGIYLPNRFGLRLEEIVMLRADGPEILSDLPRDARIIDG
ncbi:MAG: Xaa-Pro peptidase family protein [Rhodobacteraceae bacterium]|nr:Xaa-Pro peptidase family protein [Paracoccaceae bacterium]MCY4326200.1 Xaa-Pro peptidase family protein [Paracoccaceae bacterium]